MSFVLSHLLYVFKAKSKTTKDKRQKTNDKKLFQILEQLQKIGLQNAMTLLLQNLADKASDGLKGFSRLNFAGIEVFGPANHPIPFSEQCLPENYLFLFVALFVCLEVNF